MGVLDKFSVKGKTAIVTGGAQGLGKAMAEALAEGGADLMIADINTDLAKETAAEFEQKYGIKTSVIKCDVSSPVDAQKLADETVKIFGKIVILINNAGITKHIAAEDVSPEDWLDVINIDLNGVFFCAQACGRQMIKQKSGNIINISSMSGLIVNIPQDQASYNTAKAGVIHLTKSLASEWAEYGIRVNAICPGYMMTDMTKHIFEAGGEWVDTWMRMSPMKRPGTPEELQGLVLYLASDASTFTNGAAVVVDGAYSVW